VYDYFCKWVQMVGIFQYSTRYGKLVHDVVNYTTKVNVCNIIGSFKPRPMPQRLMPPWLLLVRLMPLGLLTKACVIKAYAT
jgi:hypothetical protein